MESKRAYHKRIYYQEKEDCYKAIARVMEKLQTIQNLNIEQIGTWLWVSGDTKPHKALFKKLGLCWASKKQRWYLAGLPPKSNKHPGLMKLRLYYGSKQLKQSEQEEEDQHKQAQKAYARAEKAVAALPF